MSLVSRVRSGNQVTGLPSQTDLSHLEGVSHQLCSFPLPDMRMESPARYPSLHAGAGDKAAQAPVPVELEVGS